MILALYEDWITLADPEWLRVVARGCKWILGGFLWGMISFAVLGVLIIGLEVALDAPPSTSAWLFVPAGCSLCCVARGLWLFASPHPRLASGDPIETPRRFVRWGTILTVLTLVLILVATLTQHPGAALGIALIGAPFGLGGVVALWMLGTYTAKVAQRAGSDFYARTVRTYRWGYLVSWLSFAAGSIDLMSVQIPPMNFLSFIGMLGVLGFGVLLTVAPLYVADVLEECATIAADNWNQAERFSEPRPGPTLPATGASESEGRAPV